MMTPPHDRLWLVEQLEHLISIVKSEQDVTGMVTYHALSDTPGRRVIGIEISYPYPKIEGKP